MNRCLSAAVAVAAMFAAAGCEVGSVTKGKGPFRAPAGKNSGVSNGANSAEVGTALTVSVTVKDKSGFGIPNVIPAITATKNSDGSSTGITSGGCGRSDTKGVASCTLQSSTPGDFTIKVLSPVVLTGNSVNFYQIPRSLQFTTAPSAAALSQADLAVQPVVRVLDNVGALASTVTGMTPISMVITGNSTAKLNGTTSATPQTATVTAGVATFAGLDIDVAATHTLTATLAAGTFNGVSYSSVSAASSSIVISAGAAASLKFSTQPSSSTATGVPFVNQPVIIQVDAAGNAVATDSTCIVTLTLSLGTNSDTGDTLLGSTVSKTMILGVADFTGMSLRVNRVSATTTQPATYQIQATPSGTCAGLVLGAPFLSTTFQISLAGLPSRLSLVQAPGSAALNETWLNQPIIAILDVTGAMVTNDNTTRVLMTKEGSSPGGTLVGSTSVQVSSGLAQFSGLVISSTSGAHASTATSPVTPYKYTFTGVNPGLPITGLSGISQVISANGLVPSALEFRVQPTSVAVNEQMGTIEVKTVDSSGYFCFNDNTSAVQISFSAATWGGAMEQGGFPIGNITAAVTAVNGIVSVSSLNFTTAGAKQVQAVSAGLTTANSSIFAVNNHSNTADHITFSCGNTNACREASNAGNTSPWSTQPRVGVVDAFGNLMTSDNATFVTVGCFHTPTCAISADNLTVRVVNGSARFNNMRITNADKTGILLNATANPALPITTAAETVTPFNQP